MLFRSNEHVVHVEIVLEVALIAVARKVVIIDVKEYSSETLVAIAAIVVALAGAYYLQNRVRNQRNYRLGINDPLEPKSPKAP